MWRRFGGSCCIPLQGGSKYVEDTFVLGRFPVRSLKTVVVLKDYVKLRPDYSCSGLWLVCMWTGSRAAHAIRATGSCGSDCCRYIKGRLASLWRTEIRAAQMTRSAGTVNMEWTNDATLQLISEYEKYGVLWDRTRKFYKLVNRKMARGRKFLENLKQVWQKWKRK